jgi:hypothetical protein
MISLVPVFWFIKAGKLKHNKGVKVFTVFSAAYVLICLVSALFSKNLKIAILGFPCQQEGILTNSGGFYHICVRSLFY